MRVDFKPLHILCKISRRYIILVRIDEIFWKVKIETSEEKFKMEIDLIFLWLWNFPRDFFVKILDPKNPGEKLRKICRGLPGGSPVSIKWPSSVLYGNFTFSFTYLSYTKHYKFRKTSDLKQQERKLSGKMLACCAGGQGSIPRSGRIVFFICLISQ